MINDENSRPEMTRAQAFDYVGKPHWIPANMGVRGDVPWGGVVLGLECHVVDVVSHRAMVR